MVDVELLKRFDAYLVSKGLLYEASIIGGAAILLVANAARATGDVDSLLKIPENIKMAIAQFALVEGINERWFNDNASRNFNEFVVKGENVFHEKIFEGQALTLFLPSIKTVLLSKFYPIIDRAQDPKDFLDLESLIDQGFVEAKSYDDALETFEYRMRYEDDREILARWREVISLLNDFRLEKFG